MSVPGAFDVFESFEPAVNREEVPEYGPLPPAYSLYPLRSRKITVWEAAAPIITSDGPTILTFAILMHVLILFYATGLVEMGPETYLGIQLILLVFTLRKCIEGAEDVYTAYKYEVPSPECECRGCQWRTRD